MSFTAQAQQLRLLLIDAKNAKKRDFTVYEAFKRRVALLTDSSEQYEAVMRELIDILKL